MKLLVYVPQLSPRIKYIFGFIFEDILKTELGFTTNAEEFKQSMLPKFSYAPQPLATELFFKSSSLLTEHKIIEQDIKTTRFAELQVPFAVTKSTLPFDPFAASFYFLSRYEEYLPFKVPENQLYPAESSLQHQFSLLKFPVIDSWALILKNILLKHFPGLPFGAKRFSFQPLYVTRPTAMPVKQNIFSNTINRIKTFIEKKINNKAEKITAIREIIADMQRHKLIQKNPALMPNQVNGHHLDANMQIPKSYVKLTKNKISNDYSMYYSNKPGFRAGTCIPFHWYDLQLEKVTQLLLHPVAATDLTLLNNKTDELLLQINELIDHVKLVNGDFYFLSLCNDIRPQ
jgi:hypothetical protein